jgi:hypothetical protein
LPQALWASVRPLAKSYKLMHRACAHADDVISSKPYHVHGLIEEMLSFLHPKKNHISDELFEQIVVFLKKKQVGVPSVPSAFIANSGELGH